MIPIEICYEIQNREVLAILEAFKSWQYYLKGCKYQVFSYSLQLSFSIHK